MSEFGDIFYDLDEHVQDACKDEILRSNLFVLIIGNNYGSIYHRHAEKGGLPDSVTLQEFRKALEVGIPKYIFINRFVQHDFDNYRRALSKYLTKHFSDKNINDTEVENTRASLREKFDSSYPFPQEAYRYVFYFLEIIYSLEINNAVFPFESFEHIKDNLKKQWAGFFYDALTKERTVAIEKVETLGKRLEKIEYQLRLLADSSSVSQDKNKLTIDIKKLLSEFDIADLEALQERIHEVLNSIMYFEDYSGTNPRATFQEQFTSDLALGWLNHISELIQDYKWSQYIPFTEVIKNVRYKYWKNRVDVPHKSLVELYGIFNSLEENDKKSFLNTISLELNKLYEPEPETTPDIEPF